MSGGWAYTLVGNKRGSRGGGENAKSEGGSEWDGIKKDQTTYQHPNKTDDV